MVSEMRATLTCNVGASLYGMDHPELALVWFEKGLDEVRLAAPADLQAAALTGVGVARAQFQKLPFSLVSRVANLPVWLFYGNVNDKRVEYVQARIADIKAGKKADGSTYQDAYGKSRNWTQHEMEGKPTWSWLSPLSWFGYGQLTEVAVQEPPGATAA